MKDKLEGAGITVFDKVTATPEAMAEMLAKINAADSPWNEAFHRTFCDECDADNCDAENCPHNEYRDNPVWWLGLDAPVDGPVRVRGLIIRMTLRDNDYTDMLERFAANVQLGYPVRPVKDKTKTIQEQAAEYMRYSEDEKRWACLMLEKESATKEDREWICAAIREAWRRYVSKHGSSDYLRRSFECSVVENVTGAWENGEVVYYFPRATNSRITVF